MKSSGFKTSPVYLDNNATTPVDPEVIKVMTVCLREYYGNPSSGHNRGLAARKIVDEARNHVAGLIGAKPDEIIFTSGGTEANNMAIAGTALRFGSGHIISSCIEHPSVLNPLKHLEGMGFRVTYLPVDRYGIVDPDNLRRQINKSTVLITIMHSNNETGAIQPVSEIGKIAREQGIVFHCDAAQSIGKVPVNVKRLSIDLLTIVSHKFYGPKGIGALYIRDGIEIKPIMFGASHEKGLRPGTENVPSIAGLGKACELAKKNMKFRVANMKAVTKYMYDELRKQIPGIRLNGHMSKRLPNTLNLSLPGVQGSAILDRLRNDVEASTGSACHEGKHTPSFVLKAMGLNDIEALAAVRLSLGKDTSKSEVKKAVNAIVRAYRSF
jgi:cysteine desulfurase